MNKKISEHDVRCEGFTIVKSQTVVFCVTMPYSLAMVTNVRTTHKTAVRNIHNSLIDTACKKLKTTLIIKDI
jgi:hypothetical protein